MGYLEAILAIVAGFFKSIPIFDRWFTKSTQEKIDDAQKKTNDDIDETKKTGRPKW